MADQKDNDGSAEQAYAAAASEMKPENSAPAPKAAEPEAKKPEAPADEAEATPAVAKKPVAKKAAPKAKSAPKPAAKKPIAKKAAAAKPAAKKAPLKKATAKKAAPKAKPKATKPIAKKAPAKKPVAAKAPTVTELKEKIMATKTTDFTDMMSKSMTEAVAEMQSKAQAAYDKGTTMVADMTELAKDNVEAMVESSKIMAAGVQDMGKTYAAEAKSAYETMTADMKEMAGVKSPTELFQLQGKIMRRNFDSMVATTSKNTEAAMKLANDVMAPLSARVNVAVEKMSKAA